MPAHGDELEVTTQARAHTPPKCHCGADHFGHRWFPGVGCPDVRVTLADVEEMKRHLND